MRVVITGATGLIGSELASALLARGGYDIVALSRSQRSVEKLRYTLEYYGHSLSDVELREVDMFDFEALSSVIKEADIVFHTAAIVDLSGADVVAENVALTEMVTEACLKVGKKELLLVHISSIAALPETIQSLPNASPYAQSKFLCENVIWRAHKLGLRVGLVAPAVVLGVGAPGSGGLQPVITRAQRGLPFYTEGATGFVDVKDVARAMVWVAQNESLQGERLVLCSGNMNYKELLSKIALASGKKKPFIKIGPKLFACVVALLKLVSRKPLLTSEMGAFLFSQNAYDGSEIERRSDFRYTPIDETIKDIIAKSNAIDKNI